MTYYLLDNPNPNFGQFGWKRTRVSGAIGVHTAENNTDFDGADPGAEDVARFIGRRTDPGSYHSIADADSRIKLIHPRYAAWADTTNNAHGMSVSGAMQAARWRELTAERASAITRNMAYAAAELVQDAIAAGLLDSAPPARRITPAEAIAGSKAGFYGHGETNAGRRYDPGQNFDWTLFLQTYASALGGGMAAMGSTTATPAIVKDWLDMATKQEVTEAVMDALNWKVADGEGGKLSVYDLLGVIKPMVHDVPRALLDSEIPRAGEFGGNTSLRGVLAYADQKHIEALRTTVTAAHGDGVSADQIIQAVRDALAAGVKVEASVTVGQ